MIATMPRWIGSALRLGSLVAVTACARPAATIPAAQRCPVARAGDVAHPWRLVNGAGFSYCVPAGWRPAHDEDPASAVVWQHGVDTLGWDLGPLPSRYDTSLPPSLVGQIVTMAELSPSERAEVQRATPTQRDISAICSLAPASRELIDGQPARLMTRGCRTALYTVANWPNLELSFVGSASGVPAADEELQIYRTVRFTDRHRS